MALQTEDLFNGSPLRVGDKVWAFGDIAGRGVAEVQMVNSDGPSLLIQGVWDAGEGIMVHSAIGDGGATLDFNQTATTPDGLSVGQWMVRT